MASSSSLLSEDQFLCSVCLDVFTDPVTTPCGHNFCMTCLKELWDSSKDCQCPSCKEQFQGRPELHVNSFISRLAAEFRRTVQLKGNRTEDEDFNVRSNVFCGFCTEKKLKAVKSCLDCGTSYCETHLESHQRIPTFKKHKLMDPVENLEDYICQKHERPLELFCRDDQICVCQFCIEGDHKTHNTVPLEEESEERKAQLGKTQTEVQQMIQDKLKKIEGIRHSVELSKKNTEREIRDGAEVLTALVRFIERRQPELTELMKEKQKAAERQAEGLIKELEQEITELKRRDTELEQLSHSEDHLHLLQVYPTLCSLPYMKLSTDISTPGHLRGDTLRQTLLLLEKTLNKTLAETVTEDSRDNVPTELKRIKQYAVNVTLDPDTVYPDLILSDDGKQVRDGDTQQNLPDNPERFDKSICVLGKEGFSSGRFYYEVGVRGKTEWDIGVVRESINRKGEITLSPEDGYWTIILRNGDEFESCDTSPVPLSLRQKPQKVGVFVDYEEGLVSFYDVEARSHIYSFTGQSFTEKLYPYFSPGLNRIGKNSAPLVITPVRHVE
ncbi:E3 ubiquitin-protein ligase TRIM39-like isoform X3 [Chanos chanos]|uniref:E3 ubiquitin-protein ligase TRIM39-like isoform X3 n=1 Tax=Chanos chanos TaxID=29144 RepID=A0A6J2VP21_CHACN|nr:E3 ubiquitin-protein ligase TRIM39-like isoform X3 [Chanos chanos]